MIVLKKQVPIGMEERDREHSKIDFSKSYLQAPGIYPFLLALLKLENTVESDIRSIPTQINSNEIAIKERT